MAKARSLVCTLPACRRMLAVDCGLMAMYDDAEGEDKAARVDSYRTVRNAPMSNTGPTFPDQDPSTDERTSKPTQELGLVAPRMTPAGTNLVRSKLQPLTQATYWGVFAG